MEALSVDSLHVIRDSLVTVFVRAHTSGTQPHTRDWYDWAMLWGTWLGVVAAPLIAWLATRYGVTKGARLAEESMTKARAQEIAADAARRAQEIRAEREARRLRVKRALEYILNQVFVGAKLITDGSDAEPIAPETLLKIREACVSNEGLLEDMHLLLPLEEETNIRENLSAAVALVEAALDNERHLVELDAKFRTGHASMNSINEARTRRQESWKQFVLCRVWAKGKSDAIAAL